MRNFYHKVAVASTCIALAFVLGASKEVKTTTITLTPTIQFGVNKKFFIGSISRDELSPEYNIVSSDIDREAGLKKTRLAEFNISSFFLAPNTIIRSAVFQDKISSFGARHPVSLSILGYEGNGTAEASDYENGVLLSSVDISSSSPSDTLNFDVTTFINQRVSSNGNPFVGFAITMFNAEGGEVTLGGTDALGRSSLVIETVDTAKPMP
jgi:hypothetical protein